MDSLSRPPHYIINIAARPSSIRRRKYDSVYLYRKSVYPTAHSTVEDIIKDLLSAGILYDADVETIIGQRTECARRHAFLLSDYYYYYVERAYDARQHN